MTAFHHRPRVSPAGTIHERTPVGGKMRRVGLGVFFASVAVNAALGIYARVRGDAGEGPGDVVVRDRRSAAGARLRACVGAQTARSGAILGSRFRHTGIRPRDRRDLGRVGERTLRECHELSHDRGRCGRRGRACWRWRGWRRRISGCSRSRWGCSRSQRAHGDHALVRRRRERVVCACHGSRVDHAGGVHRFRSGAALGRSWHDRRRGVRGRDSPLPVPRERGHRRSGRCFVLSPVREAVQRRHRRALGPERRGALSGSAVNPIGARRGTVASASP